MPKGLKWRHTSEFKRRIVYLALGVAIIALIFWYLQFSTAAICCGDYDGYYHVRWSRLLWEGMREGRFPPTFDWLPLTTLNPADYNDHHLLFHLLQIPFTWFSDLRFGAKVGAWFFSTLGVFSCYWLIVRYRISYPILWLIAIFASSNAFLWRINMTKAMSLSLALMVTGIYLLFQRKYIWLMPLAFLYVWTYSLWVMLGVAALIWAGVIFWSERSFEWRPIVWTLLGVSAGFIINPYFPQNVWLFYEHVLIKATAGGFSTAVGGEWYPFNTWEFVSNCSIAFVATMVGYIAFGGADKRRSQKSLFFLCFSTALLIANARSRRWVEYWAPFAILFAAFSWQSMFNVEMAEKGSKHNEREINWKRYAAPGVITAVLCVIMLSNIRITSREIAASPAHEEFAAGMMWVRGNIPPGELIFNTGWDDFPKIFYYDTTHRYVSGLDPTYLLNKNRALAELYDRITLVEEREPAALINTRFGARYVFTKHNDFYRNALSGGEFEELYKDEECAVLRIKGSNASQ